MKKQFLYIEEKWVKVMTLDPRDIIEIKTEYPIVGVSRFTDFSVMEVGPDGFLSNNKWLTVTFRYSVDAINFSKQEELTKKNIRKIIGIRHTHPIIIEYAVRNNTSYKIDLISINLEFNTRKLEISKTFSKSLWADYLNFYDRHVLLWAVNVLNKVYRPGIVAKYVKRGRNRNNNWEDKDFIDFWWTTIHLFAFRIYFAEKMPGEVLYRKDLLTEFLRQRGMYTSPNDDLGELYYLVNNYYNEMRRRGTYMIYSEKYGERHPQGFNGKMPENYNMLHQSVLESQFDKDVVVRGELLRLLGVDNINELDIFRLEKEDCGWYVGISSPTYTSPTHIKGYIKDTRYLAPSGTYDAMADIYRLSGGMLIGTNSNITDLTNMTNVNTSISYEITFCIRRTSITNGAISFGVTLFSEFGNVLGNKPLFLDGSPATDIDNSGRVALFFKNSNILRQRDTWYFVRGIIYTYDITQIEYPLNKGLNIGIGNHLKFPDRYVSGIIPYIQSYINVEVKDLKIRPAVNQVPDCLSQTEKIVVLNQKSNREYNPDVLQEIIDKELIDYGFEFNYITEKPKFVKRSRDFEHTVVDREEKAPMDDQRRIVTY